VFYEELDLKTQIQFLKGVKDIPEDSSGTLPKNGNVGSFLKNNLSSYFI
jgi:hypothetical protein